MNLTSASLYLFWSSIHRPINLCPAGYQIQHVPLAVYRKANRVIIHGTNVDSEWAPRRDTSECRPAPHKTRAFFCRDSAHPDTKARKWYGSIMLCQLICTFRPHRYSAGRREILMKLQSQSIERHTSTLFASVCAFRSCVEWFAENVRLEYESHLWRSGGRRVCVVGRC